jgi:hypothetical protein
MPDEPGAADDRSVNPPAAEPEVTSPEPAVVTSPEPADASTPDGPWSKDLETAFADPAQRAAVDEFLRQTVQPHVTRLEQDSAANRNANRLWNDFTESPNETFLSVATELYGADQARQLQDIIAGSPPDEPGDPAGDEYDIKLDELPPQVREAVEFAQSERRTRAWNDVIEKVKSDNPDLNLDPELFAPFVNATDGDIDRAVEGYKAHLEKIRTQFNVQPETTADPAEAAPNTIGRESASPTTPPVEEKFETVDDAIDSLFKDMQAAKAPTTL